MSHRPPACLLALALAACTSPAAPQHTDEPDTDAPPEDTAPEAEECDPRLPVLEGTPTTFIAPVGVAVTACNIDADPCQGGPCPTLEDILELSGFLNCEDAPCGRPQVSRCTNSSLNIDHDTINYARCPEWDESYAWTFDRAGTLVQADTLHNIKNHVGKLEACCSGDVTRYWLTWGTFSWDCDTLTFYHPNDFLPGPPQSCEFWD